MQNGVRELTYKEAKELAIAFIQEKANDRKQAAFAEKRRKENAEKIKIKYAWQLGRAADDPDEFISKMNTTSIPPDVFVALARIAEEMTSADGELWEVPLIKKISEKFNDGEPAVMYNMFLRVYASKDQLASDEFRRFQEMMDGRPIGEICAYKHWERSKLEEVVRVILSRNNTTMRALDREIFSA